MATYRNLRKSFEDGATDIKVRKIQPSQVDTLTLLKTVLSRVTFFFVFASHTGFLFVSQGSKFSAIDVFR